MLLQSFLLRILDSRISEAFGDVVPTVEQAVHVLAEHLALGLDSLIDLARRARGLLDPHRHLWGCELGPRRWRRRRLNRRFLHRCSWIRAVLVDKDHPSLRLV